MSSPLTEIAPGVHVATAPVSFLGLRLTSTMTVLRLDDGGLVVHSPVALTETHRDAVEALGPVRHLHAPNTHHHLALGDWSRAFPSARVHAPSALAQKRPDLRIDRAHDREREPAFDGQLDEISVGGFTLVEAALVHRASRTAVVADLLHNVGRPEHAWTRTYARAAGFCDRVAISRVIRWLAFPGRDRARTAIDAILARDFDTMIVGHGAPLRDRPRALLEEAYRWLR